MEDLTVVLILGACVNNVLVCLYFFSTRAGYAF